jgi:hypothetical protein
VHGDERVQTGPSPAADDDVFVVERLEVAVYDRIRL